MYTLHQVVVYGDYVNDGFQDLLSKYLMLPSKLVTCNKYK